MLGVVLPSCLVVGNKPGQRVAADHARLNELAIDEQVPDELAALVSPDLAGYIGTVVEEHSEIYHDNTLTDEINRMCLADARMFLPGLNLAYTDRASMAASVEVRVPFVDPVVARAAFSVNGTAKIQRRQGKVALKKAAEAWLPHEIVHRPKSSFGLPLRAWMARDLRGELDATLPDGALVSRGYLDGAVIRRMIDHHASGRADHAQALWQLLAVEHWVRAHAV